MCVCVCVCVCRGNPSFSAFLKLRKTASVALILFCYVTFTEPTKVVLKFPFVIAFFESI